MALTLLVSTYQNLPPSRPMSKQFGASGGTIGRGPTNDLILPDPLQFVSRTQAKIQYRDGAYFILDQGRNPIILNGKPLGSGREAQLSDGDRLAIGDYSLHVRAEPHVGLPAAASTQPHTPAFATGSLLGDDLDPVLSIRPIGEGQHAFGIDIGGGSPGGLGERLEPAGERPDSILSSGTQRDELHGIFEPLPSARAFVDTPGRGVSESSLLDGLEAGSSPGSIAPQSPRSAASSAMPSQGGNGRIPDDFNPFSLPGVRAPSNAGAPAKAAPVAEREASAPPSIPDDFDPFDSRTSPRRGLGAATPPISRSAAEPDPKAQRTTSGPPPAPTFIDTKPGTAQAARALNEPKPPSGGGAKGAQSGGEFALLEGLGAASSAPVPGPASSSAAGEQRQANPAAADPERFRGTPTDPFAETAPMPKPSAAELRAAAPGVSPSPSAAPGPAQSAEQLMMAGYERALNELLSGAGVPELAERVRAIPQPMRRAGELLRMIVVGLQRVLVTRAVTKQEMRVDMTIVHQRENNPLKFSADASDALMHLLAPREAGVYLPPERAVIEAFEDVQAHHLAVMAGMRAALHGVLRRFDPQQLERRLQSHPLLDKVLPMTRKAKMWDLLGELHRQVERESDDEFDRLFGQAFRAAYEQQIRQLRGMRKKDSSKPS